MLRLGFMPSDFHPVLLVLGDHSDIARFSEILSTFAENGAPDTLSNDGLISAPGSEVKLAEHDAVATGRPGLWPEPGGSGLRWSLPREGARQFAETVLDLARSGEPSGSVTLECAQLGEIRVVVSIGEWEDDFLAGANTTTGK